MTTPTATLVAAIILAPALIVHPFGPTYSFMPFGTNGTGALRLNTQTGEIAVCSFAKETGDQAGHSRMTCGATWPR